jgi:zinc protease
VTPEMLQKAAKEYFQPENRTLTILSPPLATATNVEKQVSLTNAIPVRTAMSNGVPLIVREDHRLPFVYFCVSMGGGLLSEEENNNGITKLMANLLVKGTKTRSRQDIANTVESLGGMLSPYSGYNGFGLEARCLTADAPTFMQLISDCLLNASFPDEEIEKQKVVQIAQIDEEHERPSVIAQEALRGILFPGHPYRWNPLGKKETVGKISRADLQAHLRKLTVSGNTVIAIFGDITPGQAGKLAGDALAGVPKAGNPLKPHDKPAPTLPTRTQRNEPKEQTVLLLGFPGVSVSDPRSDSLAILQHAMSGLSSDLAIEVRDKRGLAYYVGAQQQTGVEPGAFVIYAGTREDAVQEVEQLMRKEVDRIFNKGLRKEEIDRARNQIIADFEMGLQDNLGSAMNCALEELYGLGYQHFFNTRQRFETVTAEDIQSTARTILSGKLMGVSVVLPEPKEKQEKK